ncbi:hypothetical protein Lser_V15G42479 [Lactuca serriola]
MRKRLNLNETIDKVQYEQYKKEKDYRNQVLLRIIAVVKFLAKHNLAFRGSNEKLYKKDNVKVWSLKSMCQTRWESRVESVKAIKMQLVDVREALLQVGEKDNDVAIASEATSLIEKELGDFEFLRSIERKKRFDESSSREEVSFTPEENFRVNYFLYFVDQAISSLETRFEQFKEYDKVFGFLFPHNLKEIEDKDLKSSCHRLEKALKFDEKSDIDADELYTELKLFETLETNEFSNPIDVLKFLKELDYFLNASIAYIILLTIPVTVASAERSFSMFKLLKSYLCSTMSQERLSGLAMISIENEILESID